MKHEVRDEVVAFIKERATTIDDIVDVIIALEFAYDIRTCVVTRGDVEDEYAQAWEFQGDEKRTMSEEEWQKFRSDWFWRKGHSEVLWEGVSDAITWDLNDCGLLPKNADIL